MRQALRKHLSVGRKRTRFSQSSLRNQATERLVLSEDESIKKVTDDLLALRPMMQGRAFSAEKISFSSSSDVDHSLSPITNRKGKKRCPYPNHSSLRPTPTHLHRPPPPQPSH